MKQLLSTFLVFCILSACALRSEEEYRFEFLKFTKDFQRSYSNDVVAKKYQTFKDNLDFIDATNAKQLSYTLGINQFADLTLDEFAAAHIGPPIFSEPLPKLDVPPVMVFDWAAKGAVTPVRDQGNCKADYAFTVAGQLEGLKFIRNKTLTPLSVQELVDCTLGNGWGTFGCAGGYYEDAYPQYTWPFVGNTIGLDSSYPYTATNGTCHAVTPAFSVSALSQVYGPLKPAVAKQPIAVGFDGKTQQFQLYKSGILTSNGCTGDWNNNALIVGYGTSCLKMKYSWGTSWGEQGYAYVSTNYCGVDRYASAAISKW